MYTFAAGICTYSRRVYAHIRGRYIGLAWRQERFCLLINIYFIMSTKKCITGALICAAALSACRQDEIVPATDFKPSIKGLYVLNQGVMGANNATLDYYNIDSNRYSADIYAGANPTAVRGLGDVGNDLAIYGGRLYAVVNGSNKVEVMDAKTAQRIGQVDIANCRYIAFDGGYAYVTSYAGASYGNGLQAGFVAKVDTASLQVTAQCALGYQPEGIAIHNGYAYIAISGGYNYPNYENKLAVVSLSSFTQEREVEVGLNPSRVAVDKYGTIWITSSGNYDDVQPSVWWYSPSSGETSRIEMPVSGMSIVGDTMFAYGSAGYYDGDDYVTVITYGIINVATKREALRYVSGMGSGFGLGVSMPYFILANAERREIYIGDAGDYITPGYVACYGFDGTRKWRNPAGVMPAAAAMRR
jgi:hypothetical protein